MPGKFNRLVASCVMVLILVGCGGNGSTTPVTPTTAETGATEVPKSSAATKTAGATTASGTTEMPAATAAPLPSTGSPRDIVIAALRKQLTVGPYRSHTTITSDKSTTEIDGEVIPPDRMHVKSTTDKLVSEQIIVGKKGWTRVGAGRWTTANTALLATVLKQIDGSALTNMESIITDVQSAGADEVDGAKALVFTYVSDLSKSSTPLKVKSSNKVWVNETTGLIVKDEIDGTFQGVHSKTVQTVTYDPTITIEPPVK